MSAMKTQLETSGGKMHGNYTLNGTKVRVPNAADADLFLVWANLANVNLESDEYADRVRCAFC